MGVPSWNLGQVTAVGTGMAGTGMWDPPPVGIIWDFAVPGQRGHSGMEPRSHNIPWECSWI